MVLIPIAKGFEEIEAINLIDVLRRADIKVLVAGVGSTKVSGAHHITIETDTLVSEVESDALEMIVLPGGWGGTRVLAEDSDVQRLLREMDAKNKMIGAICAAPFALNAAGVLKHNFTCYPSVENEIRTEGYIPKQKVVIDGNVMTSSGPGTALCFGLAIVEKFKGKELAETLKGRLLVEAC